MYKEEAKEPNMMSEPNEEGSANEEEQEPIIIPIVQSENSKAQSHKYVPPHARQEGRKQGATQEEQEFTRAGPTKQSPTSQPMRNAEYKELPPPPFPNRLKNAKLDKQFQKIMKMFQEIHINIPLIEALQTMPTYAKFVKEILSNKKKWEQLDTITLTQECNTLFQSTIPPKLKDPGSFDIPCCIGNYKFKALCDLGASINLMPFSLYCKLGIGDVKPTTVSLVMADRSMKKPRGIVEDVLVKVNKFLFPVDFIVLDMEEEDNLPIILGRPFLATGKAIIDVHKGELTLKVLDEEVRFNVLNSLKFPNMHDASSSSSSSSSSSCFVVDDVNGMIDECQREYGEDFVAKYVGEDIAKILSEEYERVDEFEGEPLSEKRNLLDQTQTVGYVRSFEELGKRESPKEPSIVKPPTLDLKPLPNHLKYAYLGENQTLPVIISSTLSEKQESDLLGVLREHTTALGWTIADIKGISPSICMHKILMEDDYKPSIESQRRLNPNLKEVVRKEVL